MIDVSQPTIQQIFYDRIKQLSMQSRERTFDFQYSDDWLVSDDCLN